MMFSGTPASVAMVRPPMPQQTPVQAEMSTLIMRRAETTMDEMRAGVGSGSGCRAQVLSGPRTSLGNAVPVTGATEAAREPGVGHWPGQGGRDAGSAVA